MGEYTKEDYLKAKKKVLALVQKHPQGISTMEICEKLSLDPEVALKILNEYDHEKPYKIFKNPIG